MATTIKSLTDKNGNVRMIAPVSLNHTITFATTGKAVGTSTATNLDGSTITINVTSLSCDTSELSGHLQEGHYQDNTIALSKLKTEAYETVPTSGSSKLITSGGVYTALAGKQDTLRKSGDVYDIGVTSAQTAAAATSATSGVKLVDWADPDTPKYVYCGYAGDSIGKVVPGTSTCTISETKYLVGAFKSGDNGCYKDVAADDVTVGNSLKVNGYNVVMGSGTQANTIYFH